MFVKGSTAIGSPGTGSLALTGGSSTAGQGLLDLRDFTVNTLSVGGTGSLGSGGFGTSISFDCAGSEVPCTGSRETFTRLRPRSILRKRSNGFDACPLIPYCRNRITL